MDNLILEKEIRFILDTYGYKDQTGEIKNTKIIFTRLYSSITCNNIKRLFKSRLLYFLAHLYESHDLNYHSRSMSLYSFNINKVKHYCIC